MRPVSELIPSPLASKVDPKLLVLLPTRTIETTQPGTLFFAVRGAQVDGHSRVLEALGLGAVVVVEDPTLYESIDRAILVPSSRAAWASAIARWHHEPTRKLKLVGITGTNGKSTTGFIFRQLWQHLKIPNGLIGTVKYCIEERELPSKLTTPDAGELQALFSQMVERRVSHAAVEVSSIALDQHRIGGSRFECALFTNFTQDHLDYHLDLETYYRAKRRLFLDYEFKTAVLNLDDAAGRRLKSEIQRPVLTFSIEEPAADIFAEAFEFDSAGVRATVRSPVGTFSFSSPLIGRYNLANLLGVFAAGVALGHDPALMAESFGYAPGAPGRLERPLPQRGYPQVFVDYAHSEDALRNVLKSLTEIKSPQSKLITVFGCGGARDRTKRPKMGKVVSEFSDVIVLTSDNPRTEDPETILDEIEVGIRSPKQRFHRLVNRREAIHQALKLSSREDIVLVAGKGHETYQIIGKEEFPFDDRQVIRDYYNIPEKF